MCDITRGREAVSDGRVRCFLFPDVALAAVVPAAVSVVCGDVLVKCSCKYQVIGLLFYLVE